MSAHQRELLFSGKDSRSFGFQGTIERIRYYYKTEDVLRYTVQKGNIVRIIFETATFKWLLDIFVIM